MAIITGDKLETFLRMKRVERDLLKDKIDRGVSTLEHTPWERIRTESKHVGAVMNFNTTVTLAEDVARLKELDSWLKLLDP